MSVSAMRGEREGSQEGKDCTETATIWVIFIRDMLTDGDSIRLVDYAATRRSCPILIVGGIPTGRPAAKIKKGMHEGTEKEEELS